MCGGRRVKGGEKRLKRKGNGEERIIIGFPVC